VLFIDKLAAEIRRVDGDHTLGAGALAEALAPFIAKEVDGTLSGLLDSLCDDGAISMERGSVDRFIRRQERIVADVLVGVIAKDMPTSELFTVNYDAVQTGDRTRAARSRAEIQRRAQK
jgi:hypothetical protein